MAKQANMRWRNLQIETHALEGNMVSKVCKFCGEGLRLSKENSWKGYHAGCYKQLMFQLRRGSGK